MARGLALCFGLNRVDTSNPAYAGAEIPLLNGCVPDARSMAELLTSRGFEAPTLLLDLDATQGALSDGLTKAASELQPGDLFVFTYSGHGMLSGTVSAWVLADGPFESSRFFDAAPQFKQGVRVLILSDSCHSGHAIRDISLGLVAPQRRVRGLSFAAAAQIARNVPLRAPDHSLGEDVLASFLLISGCQVNETSLDGEGHGVFTQAVLDVAPSFRDDYHAFFNAVRDETVKQAAAAGSTQTPNFFPLGGDLIDVATFCGSALFYPLNLL